MRQVRSFRSVKIILLNRDDVIARLGQIAARIPEQDRAEEVRLFGSLARGDATGCGDVDALIVVRESIPL